MPFITNLAVLQVALLISAMPAQFFISQWYGYTVAERQHASARYLRMWNEWRKLYLNYTAWMEWVNEHVSKIQSLLLLEQEQGEEPGPSLQTMLFDNDQGLFGASKTVRKTHPPFVFLRVGDVVLENKDFKIGVIVSWDPEMRASQEWIDKVYTSNQAIAAERTPHYKVLFSGPGPSSLLVAYLPQTQLERIIGFQPDIPTLENYFTHFDGERFVMQPWLREIFPEDVNDYDVNI